MKILIIGAGAVGTVYGRYFQMGGADVSFLVREKYAETCRQGFSFYVMNRRRADRYTKVEMKNFGILTGAQEVAAEKWDYVVLAMSSTGLRGPWLDELIQAMGTATLVTLQPGLQDREYVLQHLDAARLVEGSIPIVSYFAPLPGEKAPGPGIAYWLPFGSSGLFSGPEAHVTPLVALLRTGGFPARVTRDMRQELLIPSTVLTILVSALENSGWSFRKLSRGRELKLACQALPEAIRIVTRRRGVKTPMIALLLLRPLMFRAILFLSRWIVPFDFETYMRVHFTKVQDQMHESLREYLDLARDTSVPTPALSLLQEHLSANLLKT